MWQGNPATAGDAGRLAPLAQFAPLAAVPRRAAGQPIEKVGSEQASGPALAERVDRLGNGFDAGPDAFGDTAAVMAYLDLVVTTDTAIAHLAGALGRPAWAAPWAQPEWRWLEGQEDTPWHPSLRLFRQEREGDWAPMFGRMADELGGLAGQRGPEPSAATSAPEMAAPGNSIVHAPMSPGDLLDRITILEVKAGRIGDAGKQANVLRVLGLLRQARDAAGLRWELVEEVERQLGTLHARLWDAENVFRGCERAGAFGPAFVAAARTVIHGNAQRAEIKREVNAALGSALVEEKSYGAHQTQPRAAELAPGPSVAVHRAPGKAAVAE